MSNTLPKTSSLTEIRKSREHYLELIASGMTEKQALEASDLPKSTYVRMLLDDPDFAKSVELARKHRAEVWISKIADTAEDYHEADEVPGQKLIFEKMQYLAKSDNPERYGNSGKGANININLGEFRLLPPEEAKRVLAADPFAIEAEFTEQPISDEELL